MEYTNALGRCEYGMDVHCWEEHTCDDDKTWGNDRFQGPQDKTIYHKTGKADTEVGHDHAYPPGEYEEPEIYGSGERVKEAS